MKEPKLTPDQTKWKSMLDKVTDPELLSFICSTAESNPVYVSDEIEMPEDTAPYEKEVMDKVPMKPKFQEESDNMDENS